MAIHEPESDEENPIPLFKLELGVSETSAGLVCAKMAGVQDSVICRAKEIIQTVKDKKSIHPVQDVINANSVVQTKARSALRMFLSVDSWLTTSSEEIQMLQQCIASM